MVTDLLAKLATMGGSVPLAGAMASEMAFATDLEARPVVGPGAGGVGVPVAADGSPSAPRPDRVRPIPPEEVGSAVEAVGTIAAPAALGNMEKTARPTSTPPKQAAIRTAARIGPYRRWPAALLWEAPPRAPVNLTKGALPATESGEPLGLPERTDEGLGRPAVLRRAVPAAEPVQADARDPAAGRWPSGNARTMLSCTKEATRHPSSVKMSALP